ncbi:MAG: Copper-containing nitrite reductase [Formosa sp. Hel1_33_131]|nr:MAG: Copper-containing nitrite reductase [Formosa sp. Hel1_33_131]|tara:strand:+ start:3324 stop:4772 length:1449 start_codon:yes stop_codon:yes gene_type:complete
MKTLKQISILLLCMALFLACKNKSEKTEEENTADIPVSREMKAELTSPPNVPRPVGRRKAKKLIVNMEILEKEGTMTDGTTYNYWTFGGSVPGSFIRTRVGDEVEFTLSNHQDNKLPHNIDLHAATGPGGGASSSFVAPGHQKTFSFKTLNPGLFVYHCATAPVGMHIANGMYGLILVEPVGGLPLVDKEYYLMQGDFYTAGENGAPGLQSFDMQKAINENADYVVFNGRVGSLTGDNAITANVGETVRLYVGNGGPNLVSSFHVIGEIFDKVRVEGGSLVNDNVQTTLVPSGGAAIVEFKVDVPGTFIIVDHSIFRAFNKGALGMLKVEGEENKTIYSGVVQEGVYNSVDDNVQKMPKADKNVKVASSNKSLAQKMESGKQIYTQTCVACHQAEGQGIPNAFPPLAKSDYLNANTKRAIEIVLKGKTGEITVNGKKYNGVMTRQTISNDEIADVLTYVYNSWGNNKTNVTKAQVAAAKSGH